MTDDFGYTGPDGGPSSVKPWGGALVSMLHGGGPDHHSMRPMSLRP